MSENEKFSGYVQHMETHLGKVIDAEGPEVDGRNRGYSLFYANSADGDLTSVISNGVRFQNVTAILPMEFVCTLWSTQAESARFLVSTMADLIISSGRGIGFDEIVPNDVPMYAGTEIYGILTSAHPYLEEDAEFEVLKDASGEPELQIITLLPVTLAEIAYVEQHGADALHELWVEQETDLLDLTRASAVPTS